MGTGVGWGSSEGGPHLDSPRFLPHPPPGPPAPPADGVCPGSPRLHSAAAASGGLLRRVHQVPRELGAGRTGQHVSGLPPPAPTHPPSPGTCGLELSGQEGLELCLSGLSSRVLGGECAVPSLELPPPLLPRLLPPDCGFFPASYWPLTGLLPGQPLTASNLDFPYTPSP